MNIVIAALLLFFLISFAGRKRDKSGEAKNDCSSCDRSEDTSWIDELEILDIIDEQNSNHW